MTVAETTLNKRIRCKALSKQLLLSMLLLAYSTVGAAADCVYRDKRICEIDSKLQRYSQGYPVHYEELGSGDIKSRAEAEWVPGGRDIIRLTSTYEYTINELTYLIAHEFGHLYLRHSRQELESRAQKEDLALSDKALSDKYGEVYDSGMELYHQQEFEADKFAVEFMRRDNKNALTAMQRLLVRASSTDTHPSKGARLKYAAEVSHALTTR